MRKSLMYVTGQKMYEKGYFEKKIIRNFQSSEIFGQFGLSANFGSIHYIKRKLICCAVPSKFCF